MVESNRPALPNCSDMKTAPEKKERADRNFAAEIESFLREPICAGTGSGRGREKRQRLRVLLEYNCQE
jgi:hypothetical protein